MPFVQGRSLRDVSAVHSAAFDRPSRTQVFTVEIRVGPYSIARHSHGEHRCLQGRGSPGVCQ